MAENVLTRLFRRRKPAQQTTPQAGAISAWVKPAPGLVPGRPTTAAGAWSYQWDAWGVIGRRAALGTTSLEQLKRIRDYNPDAALSMWNLIRMATRIEKIDVYHAGTEDEDIDGKALIDELDARLAPEYGGGIQNLCAVLVLTLFTQGGMALEVALTDGLDDVTGMFIVDPQMIDFQLDADRVPHPVITLYSKPTPLNELQFRYVPLDPDVDDPHGRSPMWPALEPVTFQTEVLRDLKAVAHNQGHQRIDVSVLHEVVMDSISKTRPDLLQPGREDDLRAWVDGYLSDLQTAYSRLNPDDAFIHWDWLTVGSAGANMGQSINIDSLVRTIDSQIIAALKTLPVLLGRNESSTTTHATVQWQIYAQGIESIQDKLKSITEWACNLALQVWGKQSVCEITFEPPKKSDRALDAQAMNQETDAWIKRIDAGLASQDEAAMDMMGHTAVGPAKEKPVPPAFGAVPGAVPGAAPAQPASAQATTPPALMPGRSEERAFGVDPTHGSEKAEWALTPAWVQAERSRGLRQIDMVARDLWYKGREAILAIPDGDWEAAVKAAANDGHGP